MIKSKPEVEEARQRAQEQRMRETAELYLARPPRCGIKRFLRENHISMQAWYTWQGKFPWFRELLQEYDKVRVSGVGLDVLRERMQAVNEQLAKDATDKKNRASERTAAARVIHEALRNIGGQTIVSTTVNATKERSLEELLAERQELDVMLAASNENGNGNGSGG